MNPSMRHLIPAWAVILLMLSGLISCERSARFIFPQEQAIFSLASPIRLSGDSTRVFLNDYFLSTHLARIDSVKADAGLRLLLSEDRQHLDIISLSRHLPWVSEMVVYLGGDAYSLFVERSMRERFTFRFDPGQERYGRVALRGEMNDWDARRTPLHLIDGVWQAQLDLNPGRYQYLIVADGRDMLDPTNEQVVDNNVGGFNSMLEVGQFERDKTPRLSPASVRRSGLVIHLENPIEEVLVFWQNFRLPPELISRSGNELHVFIPRDARRHERSFLRVRAWNAHGPSNDLLIPLEKDQVLNSPDRLNARDKEATILYFMMVDRFFNGNPGNDDPVDDPRVYARANFKGGDLAGITAKIRDGYFQRLGINTVWMSPITQNPLEAYQEFPAPHRMYTGYHGYWPITLTTVDHRFGSEQEMHELVSVAHENNINVMLDFVSNHVHQENPLIKANPHWATTLNLPDGSKNIRLWDTQRLTTWFDTFLPSLDFSKPEVIDLMSDSAFFWIDHYGLNGFRHDATKHVNLEFWRELTRKLKEDYMVPRQQRLFQIGETFGSRELIGSYVGSGLLDGQFDFNLYFDARSVFALDRESFHKLDYSLHQSFSYYGFNNLMGNITGNHDLPRFISLAGGDLAFDEDDQEAGWEREIGVGDPSGYKKLSQLTAFIMTIPGIPVIYYGDEMGMPGAGDPDSRRLMVFDNLSPEQQWVFDRAASLTRLRSQNLALIYGDFKTLHLNHDEYVYQRRYLNNQVIVAMNKSPETRIIELELPENQNINALKARFGSALTQQGNKISIEIEPYGYEVLTATS